MDKQKHRRDQKVAVEHDVRRNSPHETKDIDFIRMHHIVRAFSKLKSPERKWVIERLLSDHDNYVRFN